MDDDNLHASVPFLKDNYHSNPPDYLEEKNHPKAHWEYQHIKYLWFSIAGLLLLVGVLAAFCITLIHRPPSPPTLEDYIGRHYCSRPQLKPAPLTNLQLPSQLPVAPQKKSGTRTSYTTKSPASPRSKPGPTCSREEGVSSTSPTSRLSSPTSPCSTKSTA